MVAKQKILFICGSLEKGKDGVGDYSRRLAHILLKSLNCEVTLLSLNDLFIDQNLESYENEINIIRISHLKNWDGKSKYLIDYCKLFQPDLISIQFVPFAYNPKGLPYPFPKIVSTLSLEFKVHIMFHELWVGLAKEDSLKFKLWGYLQKGIIKNMIRKNKSLVISTQSDLYKNKLEIISKKSIIKLPLFSNIINNDSKQNIKKDIFSFIVFGNIQPSADYRSFLSELKLELGNLFILNFIGRNGVYLDDWVNECKLLNISYKIIGECNDQMLAHYFALSNAGIITTPYSLFQKSGSAMAMFQAGLHVVCVSRPWHPNNFELSDNIMGISEYQKGNLKNIMNRFNEKYHYDSNTIEKILIDFYKQNLN